MGVVYRAYDPKLSREVALKVLIGDRIDTRGTEASTRLVREAQAMARLSHPNVLPVFDVEDTGRELFLTMEYVPGQDLRAWLVQAKRAWPEVIAVFRAAGAGLAAAHASGLVHRDFKPANVLLDARDGRVRVTDFGLARAMSGAVSVPSVSDDAFAPTDTDVLDSDLTADGTMLGTPAYMAPELLDGLRADAISDQYSFCVALFEALYGHRPRTAAWRVVTQGTGTSVEIPAGSDVPAWIGRVIERGLAIDRTARFGDMNDLLSALSRDPRQRRRRVVIGGAIVAASIASVAGLVSPSDRCPRDVALIDDVWSKGKQMAIRQEFGEYGDGAAAWDRLAGHVDDYARAWFDQRVDACRAVQVRRDQSPRLFDRRMACLDRRWIALERTIDVIAEDPAAVRHKAAEMVANLPRVASCGDREYLEAQVTPPEDAAVVEAVVHARGELARVDALATAGRLDEATTVVDDLIARTDDWHYGPLSAELLRQRGELERLGGDKNRAAELLADAYFVALQHSHYEEALASATGLVFVHASLLRQPEVALQWARHGRALVAKAGHDPAAEAALDERIGLAHAMAGRLDEAERELWRALERRERALGPDHVLLGNSHLNIGWLLGQRGEIDECAAETEAALWIWEASLGADNPRLLPVVTNLLAELTELGRHEDAVTYLDWVFALLDQAEGTTGYMGAYAHGNAATLLEALDRADEASTHYAEAMRRFEITLGSHPDHATMMGKYARLLEDRGDAGQALSLFERAVGMYEQTQTDVSADAMQVRFDRARVVWDVRPGDREAAVSWVAQARDAAVSLGAAELRERIDTWLADHALGVPTP